MMMMIIMMIMMMKDIRSKFPLYSSYRDKLQQQVGINLPKKIKEFCIHFVTHFRYVYCHLSVSIPKPALKPGTVERSNVFFSLNESSVCVCVSVSVSESVSISMSMSVSVSVSVFLCLCLCFCLCLCLSVCVCICLFVSFCVYLSVSYCKPQNLVLFFIALYGVLLHLKYI